MNWLDAVVSSLWRGLKDLAQEVWARLAKAAFDWLMDGLERIVQRVADWLRGRVQSSMDNAGEPTVGAQVVDKIVAALSQVQAELAHRRESLTAEGALAIFAGRLEPAVLGA